MQDLRGLSDARPMRLESEANCAQCGVTVRVGKGICVNCLLREGLEGESQGSTELFEDVLGEVDLPDKEWRLGNYEILEEIGRGGMGVIYRARQRHSRRIVAVKRMLSYEAESHETLERFRREAETASSLDHPNILPIYEVSESAEGIPFFSMKLATGGSLRAAADGLRSQPRECVRLIAKVVRALDLAHQRGILHRDLQPGNILLDARGEPMISDFGLAKWLVGNSDLTRTLTTFGTPGYIAPEQAEGAGADLTPAADVYSVGAILFNLLAGRPPFTGENALSVIHQAAIAPAPKLRSLSHSIDRDLETIVAHCLERDPKARYESAGELAEDLDHWLAQRPIKARPVRAPARLWRWSRRNPLLAGTAITCLVLVSAITTLLIRERAFAGTQVPEKSVAVLPFENLNADQENNFFSLGMQDDVLTKLSKVSGLKVISRSSVMAFKSDAPRNRRAISRALGVRHLLEGSVRRANGRVRINVHLTDAVTGAQLWAEQYDRGVADVFAIQNEIAQTIARELQAKLSADEQTALAAPPTRDLLAYDLFVQARRIAGELEPSEEMLRLEVTLLDQAIARDPAFFLARCELTRAHLRLYWFNHDHSAARLALATKALDGAARLQAETGEVHLVRGILYYWGYRDYASALRELAIARQSLPNNADIPYFIALISRRVGDWDEVGRQLRLATAIDPRNASILFELFSYYFESKRYDEAADVCDAVLQWKPHDLRFEGERIQIELLGKGNLGRWREFVASKSTDTVPRENLASMRLDLALLERDYGSARTALAQYPLSDFRKGGFIMPREYWDGIIALHLGDKAAAEAAFATTHDKLAALVALRPDDARGHLSLAQTYVQQGRKEDAIREGEYAALLRPIERDGMEGPVIRTGLAAIYAQVGETLRALDLLEGVVKVPMGPHYGNLLLDEMWDPLRSEPRFLEILRSIAPQPAP